MPAPTRTGRILVVDDEVELMTALCESLRGEGFEASGCSDPAAGLEAFRWGDFDILLSDLMMPGTDGIQLLRQALKIDPNLVGVIMTGQGSVPTAVEAMKAGAFDYVLKPFRLQQVLPALDRAMEVRRLRLENVRLRRQVGRLTYAGQRTTRKACHGGCTHDAATGNPDEVPAIHDAASPSVAAASEAPVNSAW